MDEVNYEKLARDAVAGSLPSMEGHEHAASELTKQILLSGTKNPGFGKDPHHAFSRICQGIMGGMLMLSKNLPEAAVTIMRESSIVAHEVHLDPSETMTWAMEGIAAVCHVAGADARHGIQAAIEENFHGAGDVFLKLCDSPSRT